MITAQTELFGDILEELKPLLPLHYEELSLHQFHGFPLNPQFGIYLQREVAGQVLCCTVRKNGVLIAYFIGFVAPGLHYQDCLTLHMDIFYCIPEERGNGVGQILFAQVKKEALRRGVKAWFVGNKEHAKFHATALFEALGFEKVETTYCMWLGGD